MAIGSVRFHRGAGPNTTIRRIFRAFNCSMVAPGLSRLWVRSHIACNRTTSGWEDFKKPNTISLLASQPVPAPRMGAQPGTVKRPSRNEAVAGVCFNPGRNAAAVPWTCSLWLRSSIDPDRYGRCPATPSPPLLCTRSRLQKPPACPRRTCGNSQQKRPTERPAFLHTPMKSGQ